MYSKYFSKNFIVLQSIILPLAFCLSLISHCSVFNWKTSPCSVPKLSDKVCCPQHHHHLPYPRMSPRRRQVTDVQHPEGVTGQQDPATRLLSALSLVSLCSCSHIVIPGLFVLLLSLLVACHFPSQSDIIFNMNTNDLAINRQALNRNIVTGFLQKSNEKISLQPGLNNTSHGVWSVSSNLPPKRKELEFPKL